MKFLSGLKNKKIIITLCACALLTAGVGIFTFAKFASTEETSGTVELEEFYAIARLRYTSDESGVEEEALLEIDENGNTSKYIELSPQEFATAKVDIEYTGEARTYCRFKMDCSWSKQVEETYIDTDGTTDSDEYTVLIPQPYPTFDLADNVFDNVQKDGWFYIKDIMESEGEEVKVINAIQSITPTGIFKDPITENDQYPEKVQIMLTVDCVQYNRVSALWKMDSLPWWGTV